MIRIRRSQERGHADHGWLDTHHTFSFAGYYDPEHTGFGHLRVLNQDRVAAGRGFGTHGHRDMEIVSYVLDGVLEHGDSMGNGSRMVPGDVQLMSAGTGVTHSEFNGSEESELHFLQMWIQPARRETTPRYEQKNFDRDELSGRLRLVVSPDGEDGSLTIGQDSRLYVAHLEHEDRIDFPLEPDQIAWLHVARGHVRLGDTALEPGDGAGIHDEPLIQITDPQDCELALWVMPAKSMEVSD